MGARVLLVDDDPDILESTRYLIETEGYEVDVARNGREAIDLLARRPPDAILLDLMMPVMNGWQFVEELRRGPHNHIPVIVLSAGHGLAGKAQQLHAADYVAKPYDVDDLLRRLARVLKSASDPNGG